MRVVMDRVAAVAAVATAGAAWYLWRTRPSDDAADAFAQPPRSLSREEVRAVDEKAIALCAGQSESHKPC